ncbi:MAG: hypothetical protein AB9873_01005 [Syntrophobacteraceae bacterium]
MRTLMATALVLSLCVASSTFAAEIKPSDVAGTPNVYCTLNQEPNPALVGHFAGVQRKLNEKSSEYVMEPIEYWLVKKGDKWALYFHRIKDGTGKKLSGWRKWYLNGDKINTGEAAEVFVQDGEVYYQWKSNKPAKLTRIE